MADQPKRRKTTNLKAPAPRPGIGRHGIKFHASRRSRGFTTDPPGFKTEKDPRGKSSDQWFDLPTPTGSPPYRLDLKNILTDDVIARIEKKNRLVFHTVGDTGGVNTTTYQQQVATYMELDFKDDDPAASPSFTISEMSSTMTARSSTTTGSSTSPTSTTRPQSSRSPATMTGTWTRTTSSIRRQIP